MAPPSRRLPSFMDELLEEILIRLPPNDPATLFRAAVVCKHWRRLISDPGFRRRLSELHQTPPLLGFLGKTFKPPRICDAGGDACFMPAAPSSWRLPHAVIPCWQAVHALHGRILFYDNHYSRLLEFFELSLLVWNPIDGEVRRLPRVPLLTYRWNAALLCAVPGCDHLDCGYNGGPFKVVLVATEHLDGYAFACVYSSEHHSWTWSKPISMYLQYHDDVHVKRGPSALVENALYFPCGPSVGILRYDLGKQELSVINLPSMVEEDWCITLITAEDGGLGFATVQELKLWIWSREACHEDGDAGWAQRRVIELEKLLPAYALSVSPYASATVDVIGVIFIDTIDGIFTVDLKSGQVRKIFDGYANEDFLIQHIVPYRTFCTPVLPATVQMIRDQDSRVGASSALKP